MKAPLCARSMNGGLCEGRRGGAAGGRNAWVPWEPAGRRDGRENSLLWSSDRVPGPLSEVWAIPSVIIMIIY